MDDQQPKHVFISYVRENQEQVDRLCQDLERRGVDVWLDRHSIKPGARWKPAIREAINRGAFFMACFSEEYRSKTETYMNEELTLAIERLRKIHTDREWFIPVLLSECDVPARSIGAGETLLDINWVPLYEDWDAGIQRILSVIKPIPTEIQNLISALRSKDRNVRHGAVQALEKFGPSAEAAVPPLIELLNDDGIQVRWTTAHTLGEIKSVATKTVPALIEALQDTDAGLRLEAAFALSRFGPDAKASVPILIEALKDENVDIRSNAAGALGNIGPRANAAIPLLIEALKDEQIQIRASAALSLRSMGANSEARCARTD